MTLDEMPVGSEGVISAVNGDGPLRCRLLDMGLIPKTRVEKIKVAPLGDPMQIRIRGYELTLRADDAKKIVLKEAGA
ncbi:MAG: ferrous iron transport protein A [Oscillospiraceae bacterium]|jgi:Fe2+ transport system protein FeoA|nr:ferrous iron transport protein A [Oscillospiraceae bacterium]